MSLEVFLLGVPRFSRDEAPLALGRRKVIALAAYFFVSRQAHSRDYLASIFWPDTDSVGARANLRKDISRLRQAFGEDSLVLDGDQVSANPAFPILWTSTSFCTASTGDRRTGTPIIPKARRYATSAQRN